MTCASGRDSVLDSVRRSRQSAGRTGVIWVQAFPMPRLTVRTLIRTLTL